MTETEFRACAEAVVAGLDFANMPAALMLVPASLMPTEPPAGALSGQATLYASPPPWSPPPPFLFGGVLQDGKTLKIR